jgi:hypothetical protein
MTALSFMQGTRLPVSKQLFKKQEQVFGGDGLFGAFAATFDRLRTKLTAFSHAARTFGTTR